MKKTKAGKTGINHLLLGDWLRYLGENDKIGGTVRAKVRCRGSTGWLKLTEFDTERGLEVNFVDVGQGDGCHIVTPDDEVLVVDAGVSDNMNRFLSWRYNLRGRNVEGAPDFDPDEESKSPWTINHVLMSHPDNDHYKGLIPVFENPKLKFDAVYHNGIVERPSEPEENGVTYPWDLGGQFAANGRKYLFDYVDTKPKLEAISDRHPTTRKELLTTFRALLAANPNCTVTALGVEKDSLATKVFVPGFEDDKKFSLQVLGPIKERVPFKGQDRTALRRLGNEGETKNGHSVIIKGRYGKLKLLLGGDLNEPSQNFLLQTYAGTEETPDELHTLIKKLRKKKNPKPSDIQNWKPWRKSCHSKRRLARMSLASTLPRRATTEASTSSTTSFVQLMPWQQSYQAAMRNRIAILARTLLEPMASTVMVIGL